MKLSTSIKLAVLGAALVAVGVGLRLVAHHTSPEQVRLAVHEALADALEADVEIGSARLERVGSILRLTDVSVAPPGGPAALTCPEALVALDALQLLRLRTVLEQIVLMRPVLTLVYDTDRRAWNVSAIRPREGAVPGDGRPTQGGVVLEDATVHVTSARLFGDEATRTYRRLQLALRPTPTGMAWQLEGAFLDGPFAGVRLDGSASLGTEARFRVNVRGRGLRADRSLWELLPRGDEAWRKTRLVGRVGADGTVASAPAGRLDYTFRIDVGDAEALTPWFPTRFAPVSGTAWIAGSQLRLRDVQAVLPAEELAAAPPEHRAGLVRVNAGCDLLTGEGSYLIEAEDLPLCRTTIEAIPRAGGDLWERLQPRGRARLSLTVTQPAGADPSFTATAELHDAELKAREWPWPLRHVSGTVVADEGSAELLNVTGVLGTPSAASAAPARFTVSGHLDFERRDSSLLVELTDVRTGEELLGALPAGGADVWELLRPEVVADASLRLRDEPGAEAMAWSGVVRLHGGSMRPDCCPLPLRDVSGTLRLDGRNALVERLGAVLDTGQEGAGQTLAPSVVDLRGLVDMERGDADLFFHADSLTISEQLLARIPEAGGRIWDEAAPRGTVTVSGKVRREGAPDRPLRYTLDVALRDVSLLPRRLPVPLDAVSGHLLLTERRALSNQFAGVTCSGHFDGAAVVHYGTAQQAGSFGVRLRFEQVDLAGLLRCLRDEEPTVRGRASGLLDIGGIPGDAQSVSGEGALSLTEGRLWETPLFANLLGVLRLATPTDRRPPVRGDAVFDIQGDRINVRSFELTGGGLRLSGFGTVGLDRSLDLKMVAVGAPEKGAGIPIVSPVISWVLTAVERELVRLDVTGTLDEPHIEHKVLSKITGPLTGLTDVLFSPIFGREPEPEE
jgi:hypothetical protein